MGAVIDLSASCWPFVLEVRSESVYIGTTLVDDATGPEDRVSALSARRPRGRTGGGQDSWSCAAEHLPALLSTLDIALAHPTVDPRQNKGPFERAVLAGGALVTHGAHHAYGLDETRPDEWQPVTVVEVTHRGVQVVRGLLASLVVGVEA